MSEGFIFKRINAYKLVHVETCYFYCVNIHKSTEHFCKLSIRHGNMVTSIDIYVSIDNIIELYTSRYINVCRVCSIVDRFDLQTAEDKLPHQT